MGAVAHLSPYLILPSIGLAGLYGVLGRGSRTEIRFAAKTGAVLLVALASYQAGGAALLVAALLLSAVGDGALVFPGKVAFLAGLSAFLLAHLAFAGCIAGSAAYLPSGIDPWQFALVTILCVLAVMLVASVWRGAEGMRIPAGLYATAILLMVSLAVIAGKPLLIAGALLFYASDAVLALETFRIAADAPVRRMSEPFVWWTYYAAQLLLATALLP